MEKSDTFHFARITLFIQYNIFKIFNAEKICIKKSRHRVSEPAFDIIWGQVFESVDIGHTADEG